RSKEEANDYRYFPDPDLLPLIIEEKTIKDIEASLPELPQQKKQRFINDYQLKAYDAGVLTSSRALSEYYDNVIKHSKNVDSKLAANWVMGDLLGALNKTSTQIEQSPITPEALAQLISRIKDDTISGKIAKDIFEDMWSSGNLPDKIIEDKGLKQ